MKHLKIYEEFNFPSAFAIDDEVWFVPSAKQAEERAITRSPGMGKIVMVHFSKAKVFYDVLDDYTGEVFAKLDSCFVSKDPEELEKMFSEEN